MHFLVETSGLLQGVYYYLQNVKRKPGVFPTHIQLVEFQINKQDFESSTSLYVLVLLINLNFSGMNLVLLANRIHINVRLFYNSKCIQ